MSPSGMPGTVPEKAEEGEMRRSENSKAVQLTLLGINYAMLSIGGIGAPLFLRLYFVHGGARKWLTSWLQSAAWPLVLIPLSVSYINRRRHLPEGGGAAESPAVVMTARMFAFCAAIGTVNGLAGYLYAFGVSYLPASTSSMILSSQLVFNAAFALLLVRYRFTPYSLNAVVVLTVASVVLGGGSGADLPPNETSESYRLGFVMTVGSAALGGMVLPLMELAYMKANVNISHRLVLEMQLVMSLFATVFSTVGMVANHDFQAIPSEARRYSHGAAAYYIVLAASAISWQLFSLGAIGAILCSSSLQVGILSSVLLPFMEILFILLFHEKFSIEKGSALVLCLWASGFYFYGERRKQMAGENHLIEIDLQPKREKNPEILE